MVSDTQLSDKVRQELKWDPSVHDDEIAVSVKDGVVTLGGSVDSLSAKLNAVQAAERVSGVRAVADDLLVVVPDGHVRSDTDIAHTVTHALRWNVQIPDDRIKVRVDNGWVTLDGNVTWDFQRKAAFRAVRDLTGVRGVRNLITIKAAASPVDVQSRIEEALRRQAELEAASIDVNVADGRVVLRGQVHSSLARRLAENAAWAAPGVGYVEDRLVLQS